MHTYILYIHRSWEYCSQFKFIKLMIRLENLQEINGIFSGPISNAQAPFWHSPPKKLFVNL